MPERQRKIETKSVQSFRGLETRTTSKWEQDGWRFVKQAPGKLRTKLTFERERPPIPKKAIVGGAAAFVALGVIITIGVVTERNDPTAEARAATTAAPESSTPAVAPTTPEPPSSAEADWITVKNSKDFAALVKEGDYCDDSMGKFADKHENQTLRFDGVVANVLSKRTSLFDILIAPGNDVNNPRGPAFQYHNVNMTSDLGWSGSDIPDSVDVGTKLRLTAMVANYDSTSCLFHLDPVATTTR